MVITILIILVFFFKISEIFWSVCYRQFARGKERYCDEKALDNNEWMNCCSIVLMAIEMFIMCCFYYFNNEYKLSDNAGCFDWMYVVPRKQFFSRFSEASASEFLENLEKDKFPLVMVLTLVDLTIMTIDFIFIIHYAGSVPLNTFELL